MLAQLQFLASDLGATEPSADPPLSAGTQTSSAKVDAAAIQFAATSYDFGKILAGVDTPFPFP